MYELRPYQADAIAKTYERLEQGYRPIVCAPTGSGKTIIAGHLAKDAIAEGKRVLFMSGRREILRQTYDVFSEICGRNSVGFLMAGESPWWFYPRVTVASWDTLKSRWDLADSWRVPAELVLVDEVHLALSTKMSTTILPYYEDKTVVGFSATPSRASGKGLGSYFTRIIQVQTVQQIIDDGFLAPCEYWAGSHADVSRLRTVRGDFENKGLSVAAKDAALIGDVIDNWLRLARERHTLVFATDIAHAIALTERFQSVGIAAETVHSKMNQTTRSLLTQQFKEQKFQVLVNVGICTYGYDVPSVTCVVLARPTKSIVLHLQMIGRGMRPKEDGGFCRILDHADNVRRLGAAEDLRRWVLDEGRDAVTNWTRKQAEKPDEVRHTECDECHYLFTRSRICPKCGWEKPLAARDIEAVEADLVKIRRSQSQQVVDTLERRAWFRMMKGWAELKGHKPGSAFYAYRDKFQEDPPSDWSNLSPMEPTQRVSGYMLHRQIGFARRKGKTVVCMDNIGADR